MLLAADTPSDRLEHPLTDQKHVSRFLSVMHVDVHTHAFPPSLPDLEAAVPWGRWPGVERLPETTARSVAGGEAFRENDDRCWSTERRVTDMDAESVALQVVSPTPVTFCHDAPAAGARLLARAQNDFLAELAGQHPD